VKWNTLKLGWVFSHGNYHYLLYLLMCTRCHHIQRERWRTGSMARPDGWGMGKSEEWQSMNLLPFSNPAAIGMVLPTMPF
jgi:hypothetical protein